MSGFLLKTRFLILVTMKSDKIIYRYERKFCIDKIDKVQIESIIKKKLHFLKRFLKSA